VEAGEAGAVGYAKAVLDSLTENVAVLSPEGEIIAVNAAWRSFAAANDHANLSATGVGVNYLEVCEKAAATGDGIAREAMSGIRKVLGGETMKFAMEYPCHGPEREHWFLLHVTPFQFDGGGAVISHIPITKRKLAERELERERDRTRRLLDVAGVMLLCLDLDGKVTLINREGCKVLGCTEEEVIGKEWIQHFLPKGHRKEVAEVFGMIRQGELEPVVYYENPIVRKDGVERLIEWHNVALSDEKGEMIGCLSSGTDITYRRDLEREVINASEEERRWISQELHDSLGAQLTAIHCHWRVLRKRLEGEGAIDPGEEDLISKLTREAIGQTRNLSRGLHEVGSEPGDLMAALENLALVTRTTSQFECEFLCPEPVVVNEPIAANHLFRIAQEATTNAIRHSEGSQVLIRLREKGGAVVLTVKDNGKGFQMARPGTGERVSEGLGLHIMKYRAATISASLRIGVRRSGGTKVVCVYRAS
jgi:PAS domain S-box-containing protein